jgi:hypothetical protein
MSNATKQFAWVMRIFAFIYLVGGVMFFFMPGETFYLINVGPKVFKMFEEIPDRMEERFWVVLATSMMAMLMVLSLYSSIYPKVKSYVLTHMVSKAVSVTGFIYLFIRHRPYFAYLLGAVTDSGVIVIVLGFYLRSVAMTERLEDAPLAPATTGGKNDAAG